jgi:hypothetical protein
MSLKDNLRFSKHKDVRDNGYSSYSNCDAIEVPYTDAIPSDYGGVMGVPISFLDKYCPEQFDIIGCSRDEDLLGYIGEKWISDYRASGGTGHLTANMHSPVYYDKNGKPQSCYFRIFIRKKQ